MATNIVGSAFPDFAGLLSTPRESLMAAPVQAAANAGLSPMQALTGAVEGAGAQLKQSVGGLFGQVPARVAQQDQLKEIIAQVQASGVDLASPEGQVALAQELSKYPEFLGMATAMRQQAAEQAQKAQLSQAQTTKEYALAQKALKEQSPFAKINPADYTPESLSVFNSTGNPADLRAIPGKGPAALEQADRIRLQQLQTQFGAEEGARRFREERDEAGRRQAAAGVPQPGEVKIGDLGAAQRLVEQYVQTPQKKLGEVQPLREQLRQARGGSGAAFEQVRGSLIKLVGDSQISNAERARITGSSGLVDDAIGKVNTLLTGLPTQAKFDEIERLIVGLEDVYAGQYNRGRAQADTVLGQARLSPETRATLLPPQYITSRERSRASGQKPPPVGTIMQGYRFLGGNPADRNNWEKV